MHKVALVTGASRGLGFAFAELLATHGFNVVICSSNKESLQAALATLHKNFADRSVCGFVCDMTNDDSVNELFDRVYDMYGHIDLTINNVGYLELRDFTNYDIQLWGKSIGLNLTSCYLGCRYSFKYMTQCGGKKNILNISSLSGIRFTQKFKGMSAYIASKHAVVGLTESLAVEGAEFGINVNCLAPGSIHTDMFTSNFPSIKAASTAKRVAEIGFKLCGDFSSTSMTGVTLDLMSDTLGA
ncbi:SDR family NAD(P)-dependent oxidoreductase [Shewanella surugensis]|uniref:SDR family oxidoreductase n=1 Tax=Shewanella surugensis TaxID=212020 RepID=A0ABT0LJF5_9GAMM|nr:SDR family oxidoreductase [Shewanella surugensis]MCL1127843.1 SDR family oxidoreductase [Shewanella surugensis]